MKFPKVVFMTAGLWGLLVLSPLYFLVDTVAADHQSVRTDPQFYYGFLAVAIAWQIGFLVVGSNPARFRTLMLPAMVEKFGYVLSMMIMYLNGYLLRSEALIVIVPDFVLGVLFIAAYVATPVIEYRKKSSHEYQLSAEDALRRKVFQ